VAIFTMLLTAALIILAVKYGLLRGIELIADSMNWSAKARGQVTGFATSIPELVCLVAAGLAGVWEVGLWNIASSNIINGFLMLTAVAWFRQWRELFNRRFLDEIGFAVAAVFVPLVLMKTGLDQHWSMVPLLVGFFVIYRLVDRVLNASGTIGHEEEPSGSLPVGLILSVISLVIIAIVGIFLGDATKAVVEQMGLHPALAGGLLGVCTSIPEMVSFFAVYQSSKDAGRLHELADTQEALDNLASSNMANVGVVYPVGLATYLVVSRIVVS
jgi:Ca2+/Na+ antiporter